MAGAAPCCQLYTCGVTAALLLLSATWRGQGSGRCCSGLRFSAFGKRGAERHDALNDTIAIWRRERCFLWGGPGAAGYSCPPGRSIWQFRWWAQGEIIVFSCQWHGFGMSASTIRVTSRSELFRISCPHIHLEGAVSRQDACLFMLASSVSALPSRPPPCRFYASHVTPQRHPRGGTTTPTLSTNYKTPYLTALDSWCLISIWEGCCWMI